MPDKKSHVNVAQDSGVDSVQDNGCIVQMC